MTNNRRLVGSGTREDDGMALPKFRFRRM